MKKITRRLCLLLGLIIFILLTVSGRMIGTLTSFTAVCTSDSGQTLYTMDYKGNYHLGTLLETGAATASELSDGIDSAVYHGLPISIPTVVNGNGSAFVSKSHLDTHTMGQQSESLTEDYLMARNYDGSATSTLLLTTQSATGINTVSTVNLSFLDGKKPDSIMDWLHLLATPYLASDGMNDQGLSIAALGIDDTPVDEENDLVPLTTSLAIRGILDQCSTTDEAIALLSNSDMHVLGDKNIHFLIADKTGQSVIVEYYKNEMTVTDGTICTNYYVTKGVKTPNTNAEENGTTRAKTLKDSLKKSKNALFITEAMDLLKKTAITDKKNDNGTTQWSVVYDMHRMGISIVSNQNWKSIATFSLKH